MSTINALIDACVSCTVCGTKGVGNCRCHEVCRHGKRHESKCEACAFLCSCGWYHERGRTCGNPTTRACSSRVKWGKYNRKTKVYE